VNLSMQKRPPGRPAQGQEYVIGFEFQMIDNQANRDALSGATHSAAALYDMIAPTRDATKPVGEFNRSRLVVRGKHIEHWLNGEKVLDDSLGSPAIEKGAARRWGSGSPVYELLVKQPKQNCLISLQNHGDEAWFKNIRIRRR
jgi:hypothetical protein